MPAVYLTLILPFRLLDFGQEYFYWAEIDLEYLTCVSGQLSIHIQFVLSAADFSLLYTLCRYLKIPNTEQGARNFARPNTSHM